MKDSVTSNSMQHVSVVIIGGGQAGLSISVYLQENNIDHLIIEKDTVMNAWKNKRWDSFSLVTPNWQCDLPGYPYQGDAPHGFMVKDEIIDYLQGFAQKVNAPVLENTQVEQVKSLAQGGYVVRTSEKTYTADQIVVAAGAYHKPIFPPMVSRLPSEVVQLHSEQYKNSAQLPAGNVLVVGTGQSGAQIAEDLHLAGRKVYLATGDAPRCARFYRGKDVVDWLADMNYYAMPVEQHPLKEGVRDNTNHYVTGRDGGRDIDLRVFATQGMELFGRLNDYIDGQLLFSPTLNDNLDSADSTYNNINQRIDQYIKDNNIDAPEGTKYEPDWRPHEERESLDLKAANITSIVWCIGFTPDFSWLDIPIFDDKGYPQHQRGVTPQQGLYFIGLPWLHTWGSGRFSGVAKDARYLCEHIVSMSTLQNASLLVK